MGYMERLEKTISDLEANSGKLASIPELVEEIKELGSLYKEANESVAQSGRDIKEIEGKLNSTLNDLMKALKVEQDSKEELMNSIKSAFIANNKEQLDAINSISSIVGNKIAVAESNLSAKSVDIDNNVKLVSTKVVENTAKLNETLSGINQINASLDEIKKMVPVINRVQIISIVAAALALVACILSLAF